MAKKAKKETAIKRADMTPKQRVISDLKKKDPMDIVRVKDLLAVLDVEVPERPHYGEETDPEEELEEVEETEEL